MLPLRYVGFCKKITMRRQKRITFKKKVYQKIFIFRGDRSFSRAKKCNIFLQIRVIFNRKPMGVENEGKSISIGFPLKITWMFGEMLHFFCSWKWSGSSKNKYFWINFFLKVILFGRPIDIFLQNPT